MILRRRAYVYHGCTCSPSATNDHRTSTGFYSSRPDAIADANAGTHTPDQWMSRSAFRRLDPTTQAGQFGSTGRSTVRGPGIANVDLSLLKTMPLTERVRLQFRAECFNVANHAMTEEHEMILVKLASADQKIPLNTTKHRVDEKQLKTLGEVADLKPSDTGTLNATLKPGR